MKTPSITRDPRKLPGATALKPTRKLTPERWDLFIKAVEETGCLAYAVATVDGPTASRSGPTYRTAMKRDPVLKEEFDAAVTAFHASLHRELIHRATVGVSRPIFFQGVQVGEERVPSDKLMEIAAREHLGWIERKQFDIATRRSEPEGTMLSLTISEAMAMPLEIRRALTPAIAWLKDHRAEIAAAEAVEAQQPDVAARKAAVKQRLLAHDGNTIDAEFEEAAPLDFAWLDEIEVEEDAE